eukprot:TRINITY_DN3915_c0_g1_i1.p1 TRINITY_DN3915_c0_g1~~TRINITY_DN3915_c0_g1_i1.p1  ORF type:complete len:858 (+),score=200.87 TRINITY_DN3915_c0_g1_i1:610-3183(+)
MVNGIQSRNRSRTTATWECKMKSADLFNIIYTSGTSGKPKGVMVHHRGIANVITWYSCEFNIKETSRCAQTVAPAFDPVGLEVFPSLYVGASLHILDDPLRSDPPKLLNWLANNEITHCILITPIVEAMLDLPLPKKLKLEVMTTGGDKLHRGFRKSVPFRFDNDYGPSECSIMASHFTIPSGFDRPPPIGKPVGNTQLYVVNKYNQNLPVGVPGELLIGGEGVTHGYLNRPELTKEKFIDNPFKGAKGMKWDSASSLKVYRTGDLVKRLTDGTLDFIGRLDAQVKIRGYRIEVGEIESCISQCPFVKENVVIVREDVPGIKKLTGYLIVEEQFSLSSLKSFLKTKLPDYMIPPSFVIMTAFPHTPNNKVDKKALPAPEDSNETVVAPRTPTEEKLVAIWLKILGHHPIGITDNFFALGGHSLSATQLISQIQLEFGKELSLACIFETPTIAGLAEFLTSESGEVHTNAEDLSSEVYLPDSITSKELPLSDFTKPQYVFLTGATGFLGAHLLYDLLTTTSASVYSLIRAENAAHAMSRIERILNSYHLQLDDNMKARIIPVPGDLSQPNLGVMPSLYREITANATVIYHNGSEVNFMLPYSSLKLSNVESTIQILKMASTNKLKAVHYVSTLSVFGAEHKGRKEDDPLPSSTVVHGGYVQTKWVSEQLVLLARERGIPTTIHRPGRITGHSANGCCNVDDFFCRFLKGCIQLRFAPEQPGDVDMIPVDYVSKAIVSITLSSSDIFKHSFHYTNKHPFEWKELYEWMTTNGYPLHVVPFGTWLDHLKNDESKQNALYPLIPVFSLSQPDTEPPSYDNSNTMAFLSSASPPVVCPKVTNELLECYFSFFTSSGFLSKTE